MSSNRFLEIDSTYRNRNLWPDPSNFEIEISQTGSRNKETALDPVSLAAPIKVWKSNQFNTNCSATTPQCVRVKIQTSDCTSTNVGATNSLQTFVVVSCPNNNLQQINNYYQGAVASNLGLADTCCDLPTPPSLTTPRYRRILFYKYLGTTKVTCGTTEYCADRALITLTEGFDNADFVDGDIINISDPTDFTNPCFPLLFIPAGRLGSNAYPNYYLYNETQKESRLINNYDAITHIATLNTNFNCSITQKCKIDPYPNISTDPMTGNCDLNCTNPISSNWTTKDCYSIRQELPTVTGSITGTACCDYICCPPQPQYSARVNCTLPVTAPTVTKKSYCLSNCIVPLDANNSNLSNCDDAYNNCFLRIVPPCKDPLLDCPNYVPKPTYNCCQIKRIQKYDGKCKTIILCDCLDNVPDLQSTFEILPFSYDNAVPFSYSGSLVSQQEEVCYQISLINLILPNTTLSSGNGSRIAFYPYVYVELTNSSGGMKNIIYSNNPNSSRVLFRVPITDVNNPENTNFIDLSSGMTQTVKFKPNDNLRFSVTLQNGEYYSTLLAENYSPCPPNLEKQISALFELKRL
jgi:hypothetical protein